MKEGIALMVRQ